jgi:hypothetical protein
MKRLFCGFISVMLAVLLLSCASEQKANSYGTASPFSSAQNSNAFRLGPYLKYVMNPAMKNIVRQENDACSLVFISGRFFIMMDKKTGLTSEGLYTFTMDLMMANGKLYLQETYVSETPYSESLVNQIMENAQTILVPVSFTETEVTYEYEEPVNLRGKVITLAITVLD